MEISYIAAIISFIFPTICLVWMIILVLRFYKLKKDEEKMKFNIGSLRKQL